jgi:hypothetical protein
LAGDKWLKFRAVYSVTIHLAKEIVMSASIPREGVGKQPVSSKIHLHTETPDPRSPWCQICSWALEAAIRLDEEMAAFHRNLAALGVRHG